MLKQAEDLADELGDRLGLAEAVRGLGKAYLRTARVHEGARVHAARGGALHGGREQGAARRRPPRSGRVQTAGSAGGPARCATRPTPQAIHRHLRGGRQRSGAREELPRLRRALRRPRRPRRRHGGSRGPSAERVGPTTSSPKMRARRRPGLSLRCGGPMRSASNERCGRELGRLRGARDAAEEPRRGRRLAERGVNISLAMTLADGLRAYLRGDKEKALLELGTATDEIAARLRIAQRGERRGRRRERRAAAAPAPISGATYSAVELMPDDREVVVLDQRAPAARRALRRFDRVEQWPRRSRRSRSAARRPSASPRRTASSSRAGGEAETRRVPGDGAAADAPAPRRGPRR